MHISTVMCGTYTMGCELQEPRPACVAVPDACQEAPVIPFTCLAGAGNATMLVCTAALLPQSG